MFGAAAAATATLLAAEAVATAEAVLGVEAVVATEAGAVAAALAAATGVTWAAEVVFGAALVAWEFVAALVLAFVAALLPEPEVPVLLVLEPLPVAELLEAVLPESELLPLPESEDVLPLVLEPLEPLVPPFCAIHQAAVPGPAGVSPRVPSKPAQGSWMPVVSSRPSPLQSSRWLQSVSAWA